MVESSTQPGADTRAALVRRGVRLSYFTIAYNTLEAVVALFAGLIAGSVALVGFGVDSAIEVTSAGASQWRLRSDFDAERRKGVERITHRIIGSSFAVLAAYVLIDSLNSLIRHEEPERSLVGIGLLLLSVIVMPALARAKRRVAVAMDSRALKADAKQTSLCAYLSVIALAGVGLNALLGWWWADPLAALLMVPIIAKEGFEGIAA
jgi:divalent metal cation (Fe/Co/Zn/Cd) transporter